MAVAYVSEKSVAELVSPAGRRAVVTGGAQGLGKAIASRLAEAAKSAARSRLLPPGRLKSGTRPPR